MGGISVRMLPAPITQQQPVVRHTDRQTDGNKQIEPKHRHVPHGMAGCRVLSARAAVCTRGLCRRPRATRRQSSSAKTPPSSSASPYPHSTRSHRRTEADRETQIYLTQEKRNVSVSVSMAEWTSVCAWCDVVCRGRRSTRWCGVSLPAPMSASANSPSPHQLPKLLCTPTLHTRLTDSIDGRQPRVVTVLCCAVNGMFDGWMDQV